MIVSIVESTTIDFDLNSETSCICLLSRSLKAVFGGLAVAGCRRRCFGVSLDPCSCCLGLFETGEGSCCSLSQRGSRLFSFGFCHLMLDGLRWCFVLSQLLKQKLHPWPMNQVQQSMVHLAPIHFHTSTGSIPRMMLVCSICWLEPHQKEKRYCFQCLIYLQCQISKLNFLSFAKKAGFDFGLSRITGTGQCFAGMLLKKLSQG